MQLRAQDTLGVGTEGRRERGDRVERTEQKIRGWADRPAVGAGRETKKKGCLHTKYIFLHTLVHTPRYSTCKNICYSHPRLLPGAPRAGGGGGAGGHGWADGRLLIYTRGSMCICTHTYRHGAAQDRQPLEHGPATLSPPFPFPEGRRAGEKTKARAWSDSAGPLVSAPRDRSLPRVLRGGAAPSVCVCACVVGEGMRVHLCPLGPQPPRGLSAQSC